MPTPVIPDRLLYEESWSESHSCIFRERVFEAVSLAIESEKPRLHEIYFSNLSDYRLRVQSQANSVSVQFHRGFTREVVDSVPFEKQTSLGDTVVIDLNHFKILRVRRATETPSRIPYVRESPRWRTYPDFFIWREDRSCVFDAQVFLAVQKALEAESPRLHTMFFRCKDLYDLCVTREGNRVFVEFALSQDKLAPGLSPKKQTYLADITSVDTKTLKLIRTYRSTNHLIDPHKRRRKGFGFGFDFN